MHIGEIVRSYRAEPVAALPGVDRPVPTEPAVPALPAEIGAPVAVTQVLVDGVRDRR